MLYFFVGIGVGCLITGIGFFILTLYTGTGD